MAPSCFTYSRRISALSRAACCRFLKLRCCSSLLLTSVSADVGHTRTQERDAATSTQRLHLCTPLFAAAPCDVTTTKRTGNNATFTANATRLNDLNAVVMAHQRIMRTHAGAGGIFTLAAQYRHAHLRAFDNVQAREETRFVDGGISAARMGDGTGNFTGAAANTFTGIGNHKSVY